ncbi:MAG: DUF3877 family protein [Candidatus Methanomethylophilaceae archaeon]
MTFDGLEERIVSAIQEMQVKLGQSSGSVSLYLPMDTSDTDIGKGLAAFREGVRPRLGDVECSVEDGRIRITVPEEGCGYVSGLPVSPVLRVMVDSVMSHDTPDVLRERLSSISDGLVWKGVEGDGFDHIAYFTDGTDPYIYCIDSDCGPMTYHRFTRGDYAAFGFDGPES